MGSISAFNIQDIKNKFNLNVFIETGTGMGLSLEYAMNYNFKAYHSIEINKDLYSENLKKFDNFDDVNLINDTSESGLEQLVNMIHDDDKILYWLDAHFPGADYGLASHSSEHRNEIRIPLESELNIIKSRKSFINDVILIDDLRIYEDGNFSSGNWRSRRELGGDGIQFIYDLFSDTHTIGRDYRDQGYVTLKPIQ